MVVFPNSKINLGLHVVEKRRDGFHNIETCFYPVQWTDALEIIGSKETSFNTSGLDIPGNLEDNLCLKAYQLLRKDFGLPDVAMHLHKAVPVGAGLGGGSSDAAFTLRLLNEQFHLMLRDDVLMGYANRLGSDCAFFIENKPCLATGKGELLEPISLDLSPFFVMLVYPKVHIATQEAYAGVQPKLPGSPLKDTILETPIEKWKDLLANDFEGSVFQKHPKLKSIKEWLYGAGAVYAAMSGSGSTLYGIFENEKMPNAKGMALPNSRDYLVWHGRL